MRYLITLIIVIALAFLLRNAVKKTPVVFYFLAVLLDVAYLYNQTLSIPSALGSFVALLFRQSALAMALFILVMFIGVMSDTLRVKRWLLPIRKELSISACILALPHVIIYLVAFLPRIMPESPFPLLPYDYLSFGISIILLLVMIPLGITSFNVIRRNMSPVIWKRIQWLSYPFFALVLLHVMSYLLPAALSGGAHALESVMFYGVIIIIYCILRIVRWRKDTVGARQAVSTSISKS